MTINDIKAMKPREVNKFFSKIEDYNVRKLRAIFRESGIEVDTKASKEELVEKLLDLVS